MKLAPSPGRQAPQLDRAYSNAGQREYWVVNGETHTPHLPIPPFSQGYIEDRRVVIGIEVDELHIGRRGYSILQLYAFGKLFDCPLEDLAADYGAISFGNLVARVGQELGELAVIRQDEQAGGIHVQPANGVDARPDAANELHDRTLGVRVLHSRHVAGGLVKKEVDALDVLGERLAVDANVVLIGIGFGARLGDHGPIYRDLTPRDQLLAGAP